MKILVTGGAGFIGSYIVDKLIDKGYDVRILDNLNEQVHPDGKLPDYLNKKAEFIKGDVTNKKDLAKALDGVDAIFHEAASVGVGQSMYEIENYTKNNSLGTAALLDMIVNKFKNKIKKILVAASMSSYGEGLYKCSKCGVVQPKLRPVSQMEKHDWEPKCPKCGKELWAIPTSEDAKQNCNSVYAINKMDQEQLVLVTCGAYDIPAVALRYFNVYGPRQSLSNPYTGVAAIFMSRIKNGNRPVVYEDGLQTRDLISVHDVADANVMAFENENANGQVFNVGTENPLPIKSIAENIAKMCDADIEPQINEEFRKGDVRHCYADISKIKKAIAFKPKVGFEDGMKELIEWSKTAESEDKFEKANKELKSKGLT
ncbi:MAG: hypothetical protein ACD_63C00180G0005 [uncultured bacterium]|nr:MAG: hypothetical protein ACD_63C00180G0005 [uncultured bacterium]